MAAPQEKAQFVLWFIEIKSDVQTQRNYRLSMEEIHHPVLPFMHGKGNLWRQGQYCIKRGAGNQEHLRKTLIMFHKPLLVLLGSPSALLPEL